jgi:hypothetical protein
MGEEEPLAMIESVRGLTEQEREQIFGRTALALLGGTENDIARS